MTRKDDDIVPALRIAIKQRRRSLNLSQTEVARRSGLNRTFISDLERVDRNLAIPTLSRLAEALELSVSELLELAESIDQVEKKTTKKKN